MKRRNFLAGVLGVLGLPFGWRPRKPVEYTLSQVGMDESFRFEVLDGRIRGWYGDRELTSHSWPPSDWVTFVGRWWRLSAIAKVRAVKNDELDVEYYWVAQPK